MRLKRKKNSEASCATTLETCQNPEIGLQFTELNEVSMHDKEKIIMVYMGCEISSIFVV